MEENSNNNNEYSVSLLLPGALERPGNLILPGAIASAARLSWPHKGLAMLRSVRRVAFVRPVKTWPLSEQSTSLAVTRALP